LAVAWSEHAFEIAFLSVSVAAFAVGADRPAVGFAAGADCEIAAPEPIRRANADIINVFEILIATSLDDPGAT
jgi:hypothetical protein